MTDKKDYMTIEELKAQKDTSNAVFAGVKTANGWGTGKMVTEQEYDAAVKAFNDATNGWEREINVWRSEY